MNRFSSFSFNRLRSSVRSIVGGQSFLRHAWFGRVALVLVGFGAGVFAHGLDTARAEGELATSPFRRLPIFAAALSHAMNDHVEPQDDERLVYGAIRGLMQSLDPHSSFLDPREYERLISDTRGSFGGVGIEVEVRDGWIIVHGLAPGGPAERAGILAGDRLLSIGNSFARDLPLSEAATLLRGEPGTEVVVRIRREAEADGLSFTLQREIVEYEPVSARVLPGNLAYVRIRAFQSDTSAFVERALARQSRTGPIAGVLLDLRTNPGGLLEEAVRVSDLFLDRGLIVRTKARGERVVSEYSAHAGGVYTQGPLIVLVDGLSASASEIVAGALQAHHRAVLVGGPTFGKGSVQNLFELNDGSAVKLTVARYYLEGDISIQARGLTPDVDISGIRLGEDMPNSFSEAMLQRHLIPESAGRSPSRNSDSPRDAFRETVAVSDDTFGDDGAGRLAFRLLQVLSQSRSTTH